ncbi:MAG: alcohol dehydrogenase catalytic domain-containing protein, partial [Flammeovirgaceae bacterium]
LAAVLSAYGPVSNLEIKYCQMPDYKLGASEILVEIYAASVNPTDCKARKGTLENICPLTLPTILGIDFSGNFFLF